MTQILEEDAFRAALDEESNCVVRGGYPTCLVNFDVGERAPRGASPWGTGPREFGEAANHALREIDVVGWTSSKQIGVILPGTPLAAAHRVAERLAIEVFPDAAEPNVLPLRTAQPHAARLPVSRPTRSRHSADGSIDGVHCDPAGVIGLLARPLPRWKRALDIVLAGASLVLCLPLLFAIAFAVKATSPGEVTYRQLRTGHRLRRFWIYKFRTMRSGAERELSALQRVNQMSGPLFKTDPDPRLSPIGNFLRRTSLDELPQLVNVLRGDMTLLGPRALSPPPSAYEFWQLRRFIATPGVACEWQASRRGETDFEAWMRSDLRYVEAGPSLRNDLHLLARTLVAVLTCAGGR